MSFLYKENISILGLSFKPHSPVIIESPSIKLIENLLKDKKYIEYGKAAKINSQNFHWNKIIEKYKGIL